MNTNKALDSTDLAILRIIQIDNRKTIKDIAAELNLSTTPIFERLKKLEKAGYVKKNVAILDANKLNLKLTAFIRISVSDHKKEAIELFVNQVVGFPEVLECHHTSGDADFLVKVVLKNIEEYNTFLLNKMAAVSNIAKIESSFVLSTGKDTVALPIWITSNFLHLERSNFFYFFIIKLSLTLENAVLSTNSRLKISINKKPK